MKLLKRIWRNETGVALPIVLILLLFGGFLVAPTLMFVSTSLNVGQIVELRTSGFMAADAGVEDCLWDLLQETPAHFPDPPPVLPVNWALAEQVNNMDVTLEWSDFLDPAPSGRGKLYIIKSTAALDGTEKGQIVVGIKLTDTFSFIFDNAITSKDKVTLQPDTTVVGSIQLPDKEYLDAKPGAVYDEDAVIEEMPADWPEVGPTSEFYRGQVTSSEYTSNKISISQLASQTVDGLWRNGDLTIKDSGTAQLNGTIWITGQLVINPGCEIDMNGFNIYSNFTTPENNPQKYAVDFGTGSFIIGPGCVIANGSVNFQPTLTAPSEVDPLFVMSIESQTFFHPNCTVFYGSVAGDVEVQLQPGSTLNWVDYDQDWEFPVGDPKVLITNYSIEK